MKNTSPLTLTESDLTGTVKQVNDLLEQNPELFPAMFQEMLHNPKSMIRLRAGNAVEKAARKNPELIKPFQAEILAITPETQDTEIIWHVALLLGYLNLEDDDLALAVNSLFNWLNSIPHKFLKINCMQTLAGLAKKHDWLKQEVLEMLQAALEHESPAIRARARILLKQLSPKKR